MPPERAIKPAMLGFHTYLAQTGIRLVAVSSAAQSNAGLRQMLNSCLILRNLCVGITNFASAI